MRAQVGSPPIEVPATGAEVLSVFDALFENLVRQRDAEAAAQLFLEERDPVMWGSEEHERATGHEAIAELHRSIVDYSGDLAFRWNERHVHVEGRAAWVNAAGEVVVTAAGEPPRTSSYRLTAVFVKRRGSWRWHTFNGSEPNPA